MLNRGVVTIAHVGDSRLYSLADGRAEQLTSDDSWAAAMLARDPSLDPGIIRSHPMRNALTRVVGSRPEVDVHVSERPLGRDELLLLTTDGVHVSWATRTSCTSAGRVTTCTTSRRAWCTLLSPPEAGTTARPSSPGTKDRRGGIFRPAPVRRV
jgi:serine/threonine protein phosphatase PrpC